jgi:UDP-N-acetylglucosamine transferase subunit ALG13
MANAYAPVAPDHAKALLVCSTGGHLSELVRLESHIGENPDSLWVTFDTDQSRQLLAGRRVHYVPYIGPRDLRGTIAAGPAIHRLLKAEHFDVAISTGASIAASALPLAAAAGVPAVYVESVCRVRGPSTTGRLLQPVPGVALRTQHENWASKRWQLCDSILTDVHSEVVPAPHDPERLFVTLGTIQGYRFDSAIDAILSSGYANENTVWQLGYTSRSDSLPGRVYEYMSPKDFTEAARSADVVVSHAGVGTLLELFGMGVYPVLAVRRVERHEHVDDHQTEIAELVNGSDLGIAVEGPALTPGVIELATRRRIVDPLQPVLRTA